MTGCVLHRGATTLPTLELVSGDISDVSAISARMMLSVRPNTRVDVEVVPRVDAPAGWDLLISEEVSRSLALGTWQLDARLAVGVGVVVTDPVGITVTEAASTA